MNDYLVLYARSNGSEAERKGGLGRDLFMIIIIADDSCPFNNAFLFHENAISLQQNRLHRLSFLQKSMGWS